MKRRMTPVDELTRMPLPIMPTDDEVLHLMQYPGLNNARYNLGRRDYIDGNHAYHPKNVRELTSQKGRAVRDSLLQMVMRLTHDKYHEEYAGPPLPVAADDRFRAIVFAVGRYVPRRALDLRGTSPKEVDLTDKQVHRLQTSGEVRQAQTVNIRNFVIGHLLTRLEVGMIAESSVEGLLAHPGDDPESREWRGMWAEDILPQVIEPLVEPMDGVYQESVDEGLWPIWLRKSPGDVVMHILLGEGKYARDVKLRDMGERLYDTLSEHCYGTVAA